MAIRIALVCFFTSRIAAVELAVHSDGALLRKDLVSAAPALNPALNPALHLHLGGSHFGSDLAEKLQIDRLDSTWESSKNSSVSIAVAIPTCPEDDTVRDAIRNTWAQRPGVCMAPPAGVTPAQECTVNLLFVVGQSSRRSVEAAEQIDDMLYLPTPDGQKCKTAVNKDEDPKKDTLKTFEWLKFASTNFTWATHIGKIDPGYSPHLHKIVPEIAAIELDPSKSRRHYLGRKITSHNCNLPMIEIEKNPNTPLNYCTYGAAYFLSSQLAADLVGADSNKFWGSFEKTDAEERDLGRAVSRYVRLLRGHVETWDEATAAAVFPDVG